MIIKVIARTENGKSAIERHIYESNKKRIKQSMAKYEIEQKLSLSPFSVIMEWKAKPFLQMIKALKDNFPRELDRKIETYKMRIIKAMGKNKAILNIDYYIVVET